MRKLTPNRFQALMAPTTKRQIYKFFIIDVWPDFFKHGIRDMVVGNECQRFGPGQGRLLTGREESGFRQS